MHPVLFKIGSFEMASYGLMTALGYAAASVYLIRKIKQIHMDADTFWNIIFIAFMGALIGAKVLFVIVSWPMLGDTLAQKLHTIVSDFRYGFVFFGGMITSVLALIYYMKKKGLPILKTADFFIVGLPLGHAVGRIGCFLAGCCYGKPTDSPLGVAFTDVHSLVPPELRGIHLHPTQLYEAVCNLLLFFFLHYAYKKPHKAGAILVKYVVGYSIIRFIIEFFRGDYRGEYILGMSPSQGLSLVGAVTALVVYRLFIKDKQHG